MNFFNDIIQKKTFGITNEIDKEKEKIKIYLIIQIHFLVKKNKIINIVDIKCRNIFII